jgi:5-methylthioadenosine/S-adenosylhomocysteine deaminase
MQCDTDFRHAPDGQQGGAGAEADRRSAPANQPGCARICYPAGRRACGLDHKTGTLTPGKEADIVLISTDAMNLIPVNNPVGAVVEFSHVGNIDTIFVAGKIKKRHGKLVDVDFPSFAKKVDAARDDLFQRAGVPTDGSWIVRPYTEEAKSEF